jgi:cytochrome c-type biogenesis protein
LFVLTGVLILTGTDKKVEAAVVDASPTWLTELTTRF